MRNLAISVFSAAMMLIAAVSFADAATSATSPVASPATIPSAGATTQPNAELRQWFDQLADTDPAVRDTAKINLMGLKREQLDQLRQVVKENLPLSPSARAVLPDIVRQVFLATEPYPRNPTHGFLGVSMGDAVSTSKLTDLDIDRPMQIKVASRFPGFCAFRYLQDGDLLQGVVKDKFIPTPTIHEFHSQVATLAAGDVVTLQVVRQGREIRITLSVDAMPTFAEPGGVHVAGEADQFANERLDKADAYFARQFCAIAVSELVIAASEACHG